LAEEKEKSHPDYKWFQKRKRLAERESKKKEAAHQKKMKAIRFSVSGNSIPKPLAFESATHALPTTVRRNYSKRQKVSGSFSSAPVNPSVISIPDGTSFIATLENLPICPPPHGNCTFFFNPETVTNRINGAILCSGTYCFFHFPATSTS
jgi:hypothetical protein